MTAIIVGSLLLIVGEAILKAIGVYEVQSARLVAYFAGFMAGAIAYGGDKR